MSVATGIGLNLPTVFLRPFMEQIGLTNGLMLFFNIYPPIAFVARVSMRRVPDRLGIRPMIGLGIAALVVGLWRWPRCGLGGICYCLRCSWASRMRACSPPW
ncbi:MAG: hypothetical protein QM775_06050 [Pirellulales bacterium]